MNPSSLIEVFLGQTTPDTVASFVSLRDGEDVERRLTHFELLQRAKGLAGWMKQRGLSGTRAMLLFPTGLEFVEAFLACLLADVIAVPVAPVPLTGDSNKVKRLLSIMADCEPSLVLGVGKSIGNAGRFVEQHPQWQALEWLELDRFDGWDSHADFVVQLPSADGIALLQYTSGSTGIPKGVMLSQRNVLSNLRQWDHGLGHEDDSRMVCWVPHFHDLGLLYGILFPLYRSISAIVLPGAAVAQKPLRWLKAISDFRGTHSMGPNFIYGLCSDRIAEQDCAGLDLSSWRMALNAAEPIRPETVEQFQRKFAPYGLGPLVTTAAYGLAEATCVVTSQAWDAPFRVVPASPQALLRNELRPAQPGEAAARMVACGRPAPGICVKIVDPARLTECAAHEIGEIWVHGDSVSSGYWNRPRETALAFGARLAGDGSGTPYLRTGDLGFIHDGEVFTTGRIKDLIIVRGENYYPQDAEHEIERAHPGLASGGCAVFSVLRDGEERIVVVQALARTHRNGPYEEMFDAIRRAVGAAFDLPVEAIALIQPGSTAKTSSGKIQRSQSKRAFLDGTLQVVASWERARAVQAAVATAPAAVGAEDVERFLMQRIAEISQFSLAGIRSDRPFSDYGLGSLDATRLAEELATRFQVAVSPTEFYDHPDVRRLATHLGSRLHSAAPAPLRPVAAPADPDAIVVVGMACQFPGAGDLGAYWELLSEGRSGVATQRLADGTIRHGGFVAGLHEFDNEFFAITRREAACMDPQQRMALQVSWHALEDAGIQPAAIAGSDTGVFFGASAFDYGSLQLAHGELDAYSSQGSVLAVIANRVAYQLDLRGPSFVVDTACSSALTAVHLACRSLRDGECRTAIVGAVNVLLASDWDQALVKAGMLAPDGQCKTFDAAADGYVRSEGCGVLVLKRQRDALADGDRIYGAILGSAVNQDGRSNGLTAPNGSAQQALVLRALAQAQVDPSELQYIEAHGTGTPLGDPIECRALARVLAQGRDARGRPCHLGSAKASVGHLEAAAGMAGLIKTLLALHHGQIPMQRNLAQINPLIELGDRLTIPRTGAAWPRAATGRRCASVSAFGFSGTNACVVVGDAAAEVAAPARPTAPARALPFVLSARDQPALRRLAARHADRLLTLPPSAWPDYAYTSTCRRLRHDTRFAVAADSPLALAARLQALAGGSDEQVSQRAAPRIAFAYTGQGMPLRGAARGLRHVPAFRHALARCDAVLQPVLGTTLEALLCDDGAGIDLGRPSLAQPVHFALQYALGQTLQAFGIRADLTFGHSLGEYAALVACGAVSVESALRLVVVRGELCEKQVAVGAMAAVFADEDTIRDAIRRHDGAVDLAAVNGPHHCVVAGTLAAVSGFCDELSQGHAIDHRKLLVERPYHSALIEPIVPAFLRAAGAVEFQAPTLGFVSNVTGAPWPPGRRLDGDYLARHLREPVRFADALRALSESDVALVIEIGSRPVLCGIGEACLDGAGPRWLPLLRHDGDDAGNLIECLLQAMQGGADVDWSPLFDAQAHQPVSLPVYEFAKVPHWFRPRASAASAGAGAVPFEAAPAAADRPAIEAPAHAASSEPGTMDTLSRLLARLVHVDAAKLDRRATFMELGVDSIVLMEFTRAVGRQHGVKLTVPQLFEHYPSLDALARFLDAGRDAATRVEAVPEVAS